MRIELSLQSFDFGQIRTADQFIILNNQVCQILKHAIEIYTDIFKFIPAFDSNPDIKIAILNFRLNKGI